MLLSMTGFGEARLNTAGWSITVEVRSVNSRYLKLNYRSSDGFAGIESQVDAAVRKVVRRGSVYVSLRAMRTNQAENFTVNTAALEHYRDALAGILAEKSSLGPPQLDVLLTLPGVVEEVDTGLATAEQRWQLVRKPIEEALAGLSQMREQEGAALAADLQQLADAIARDVELVVERAPLVGEDYRQRLTERVNNALGELNVTVEPADLLREVTMFCERSDISEEIVRMRSHLKQFANTISLKESSGRKLEFILQEMVRETNTIGSKANDSVIAERVVDIKGNLERIREQIQNVE